MLVYRAPWHYLPLGPGSPAGWGLLAGWLTLGAALWWPQRQAPAHRAAAGIVAALTAMGLLALGGTYLVPVAVVIKFQFLRLAPLIAVVVALYVGHAADRLLRRAAQEQAEGLLAAALVLAAGVAGAYVLDAGHMLAAGGPPRLPGQRLHPTLAATGEPGLAALGGWAATDTAREAVFLIPPQVEGFRVRAQRAIVVDFKTVAFSDQAILEWDRRIQAVCGAPSGTRTPLGLLPHAYAARPLAALRSVGRQYGATHILTQVPHAGAPALYAADGWWVYAATP